MNDWGAGSSPRKEYGSAMRGGSNNSDNWRRHRADDVDVDGWRTSHRGGGAGGQQVSVYAFITAMSELSDMKAHLPLNVNSKFAKINNLLLLKLLSDIYNVHVCFLG